MRDMAHSICLMILYQTTIRKKINFLFLSSLSLLSSVDHLDICTSTSVHTYEFSMLCTWITSSLLKTQVKRKGGGTGYIYMKVIYGGMYLVDTIIAVHNYNNIQ